MAPQKRFLFLGLIGVVLVVSFWYRPPPSIRAYAPSWTLTKGTSNEEAIVHLAPEFAGQDLVPIVHVEHSSAAASSAAAPAVTSTHVPAQETSSAAAISEAVLNKQHASTAAVTAAPEAHTFSAPAYTSAPVDPYTAAGSVDLYEYLHESKSEDPYAYFHSSGSVTVAPKETAVVNEFGYLSASSDVNEFAYLSASSSASAHAAAITAPTGFVTSVAGIHHSAGAAAQHVSSPSAELESATLTTQAASLSSIEIGVTSAPDPDEKEFSGGQWFFQGRLTDYELPKFDIEQLRKYAPHNYKGPGHETYATFLSTRNASLQDPYFLATLQQAHRLLWDNHVKSNSHPFTVFVAPHIPQPQRDYLTASGAYVKELELIEFHPTHPTEAAPRWRDMFTKLNLWNQTEFSRILYLDTDAFAINPLDELWDIAKVQRCNESLLRAEDQPLLNDICDYTFTATEDGGGINAGMMIFNPNPAMHSRLIRESHNPNQFDQTYMEQAFLSVIFERAGPFPVQLVERKWNAIFTKPEDEGNVNVVHEKLWAMYFTPDHFAAQYFRDNWDEMLKLYQMPKFASLRAADGPAQVKM